MTVILSLIFIFLLVVFVVISLRSGKKTEPKLPESGQVRETLKRLEDLKNKIITFIDENQSVSEADKNLWIGDIKETYYSLIASADMSRALEKDEKYLRSAKEMLIAARSRMEQSASELKSLKDEEAAIFEKELRERFESAENEIRSALPDGGRPAFNPPPKMIVRTGGEDYELLCSVCGERAGSFSVELPKLMGVEMKHGGARLLYQGIVGGGSFKLEERNMIFGWLDLGRLRDLHEFAKSSGSMEDGLDSYCPDCDKIYCRMHYNVSEEWDAGFYDCSYGTCPSGHRRIIDD